MAVDSGEVPEARRDVHRWVRRPVSPSVPPHLGELRFWEPVTVIAARTRIEVDIHVYEHRRGASGMP